MKKCFSLYAAVIGMLTLLTLTSSLAFAVGTIPHGVTPRDGGRNISSVYSVTGQVTLSTDGHGYVTPTSTIRVNKPVGATVRAAFLGAASVYNATLPDGSVSLEGNALSWDVTYSNLGLWENGWKDVTSIVAPIIDSRPAGISTLDVAETNPYGVDGEILAVVFDDPNADPNNSIILLFGGQAINGDDFQINLASPIVLPDPNLSLNMGLGISFSYNCGCQYSLIDVNGQRMSSSAGGLDDGDLISDGALLTVGGIGDDATTNPVDPMLNPCQLSPCIETYDDEAYNLIPFVNNGDQTILVHTVNPSNDDNIFFAWLTTQGIAAAVNESVILTPTFAANQINMPHTLNASVRDDNGNAIVGRAVDFSVLPGSATPAGPLPGSPVMTDVNGNAQLTYTSGVTGVDYIQATETSPTHGLETSNTAIKVWYNGIDQGDLTTCYYPTLVNNPGHVLSGIAWLGPQVDGEATPHIYPQNTDLIHTTVPAHMDNFEDGVAFFGAPWQPCTPVSIIVQVTAGPNYELYARHGGHLYLNAWKDGNADYSFDDVLCDGRAPEWFVQDAVVTPGIHTFTFIDPGVTNISRYNGVFRFRLTHQPVGQYGFGMMDQSACPNMTNGTFGLDEWLGEDEDYVMCDLQLSVELTSFEAQSGDNAVALRWSTASETQNDHFEL
ncbi:MAG TPA: Ig-like domain-containing protein, partial [bacterium]